MNLLGVSTLTDPGPNSALPVQAGLGDFRAPLYALHLASLCPSLLSAWRMQGTKARGVGGRAAGRAAYLLTPLSCAWDPRGGSDLWDSWGTGLLKPQDLGAADRNQTALY